MMAGAHEDARLSSGPVGPRAKCAGALLTPEAAAVVESPINQVSLDQVDVLATDHTGAADCTACHRLAHLWEWALWAPVLPLDHRAGRAWDR